MVRLVGRPRGGGQAPGPGPTGTLTDERASERRRKMCLGVRRGHQRTSVGFVFCKESVSWTSVVFC